MKSEKEIRQKIENYEKNLHSIKNEEGNRNVRFMIAELKWVIER